MIPFTWDWVEAGCVAATSMPNTMDDLRLVHAQGIRAVVSVNRCSLYCRPGIQPEMLLALDMRHLHEPIADGGVPDPTQVGRLIRFMWRMRSEGRPFMVHCRWGIARTGVVLWLYYRSLGMRTSAIIPMLQSRRQSFDSAARLGPANAAQWALVRSVPDALGITP